MPNFGEPGRGPRLSEGMTIAIEPMITMGDPDVFLSDDGWAIATDDGALSAHFEHTVAILPGGPRILTPESGWLPMPRLCYSDRPRRGRSCLPCGDPHRPSS